MARDPDLAREVFSEVLRSRDGEAEQRSGIDFDHLQCAFIEFDAAWDVLLPHKKAPLMGSLIQRVVCSPDGDMQIIFRTDE